MKKYVYTASGQEIKLGDRIAKVVKTSYGSLISVEEVTKELLEELLENKVVTELNDTINQVPFKESDISIEDCIFSITKRIGWKPENVLKYLDKLCDINITAVYQVLAKEIAILIDKKYPDHINNSSDIWTIDLPSGKIVKVKGKIKNFRNFPAFRSVEDALKAEVILNSILDAMYSRNGK